MQLLREKLQKCLRILERDIGDINWLNHFCAEFLLFSNTLQKFISKAETDLLEIICLCLTQILICVRHLEYTIKTEKTSGARIQASHHHFIDRITVCLKRLYASLEQSNSKQTSTERLQANTTEGVSFLSLLDTLLDALADFTEQQSTNVSQLEDSQLDLVLSKQIKLQIDLLLGQALSFANVALQQDKKALSALCQKVMRDCSAFQQECSLDSNYSNQKLRAVTLEHALNQLDAHINETMLRLVFNCFLDFQKLSVDKIRNILRTATDATIDEYIADFDVNLDRATQIGIFAIAFAPSLKVKTAVRSCLASFEYLDTSLIPSLQSLNSDLHSELLEQHFKEELSKFKTALYEILDSRAFVTCYLQILTTGITAAEQQFDRVQLEDLIQMGFFVLEHFQLAVNQQVLLPQAQECFQNFIIMLRECKAILMCASQVQTERIIKRFKILRSVLRNLQSLIAAEKQDTTLVTEATVISTTGGDSLDIVASPSRSILYETRKERSKTISVLAVSNKQKEMLQIKPAGCVKRKQSLRTAMFKRQNVLENIKLHDSDCNQSASLEISGILDQLSNLTASFAHSLPRK